jgi:hypothetical protein
VPPVSKSEQVSSALSMLICSWQNAEDGDSPTNLFVRFRELVATKKSCLKKFFWKNEIKNLRLRKSERHGEDILMEYGEVLEEPKLGGRQFAQAQFD